MPDATETAATPSVNPAVAAAADAAAPSIEVAETRDAPGQVPAGADLNAQDDALDAAYEAVMAGNSQATIDKKIGQALKGGKQQPAGKPEPKEPTEDDDADGADAAAGSPLAPLSDADKQVLSRAKLDESDLPATPEARAKVLTNLREMQAERDRVGRELVEARGGKAPAKAGEQQQEQQQQPAAAPQAKPGEHWKPVVDLFGDEVGGPLQQAVAAELQQVTSRFEQSMNAMADMLAEAQIEAGYASIPTPPDGVDLNDPAVRQKVEAEAERLLKTDFDARTFNYKHAIAKAVNSLYPTNIQHAERKRLAAKQTKSLRGSPDPGDRRASTGPRPTEDDALDAAYEAIAAGNTGAAAEQAFLRAQSHAR